jgi:hypothetical protein
MTDYLSITFGSTTAVPKAVEYDRCMIVGDGSPSTLDESTVYELDPSDWQTQLQDDGFAQGDQLYDSVSLFFSASPSPARAWAYAYISGAEQCYTDIPLEYVAGNVWEIPTKPPRRWNNNIERVRFYCCGDDIGTGFTWNYANGSQGIGFTPETDGAGNWTGRVTFTDGLSGASCGIVKPLTTDCKLTADYCIGSEGDIGEALKDYQINMVSLALVNSATLKNYSDNLFGSQLQDIMKMISVIAGKNCIWFYALPGDASPEEIIAGTSGATATPWVNLRQMIGARQDVAVIKAKPSAFNHDMATGYMAMTVISHPHQQMTFAEAHMGIQEQEPKINRTLWKDGAIASFMQRTELAGNPMFITFGFTFGSGDVSRIEGTRCRYIVAQTLTNNLWGLLAQRTTLMSYEGMQAIKARIKATFDILIQQKIVDGLEDVRIPIENDLLNNTAAGILARQQQRVPAVEIDYLWYTSVEHIMITQVDNVAT